MIQDIYPHLYDNSYHPCPPRHGDYIFSYEEGYVHLKEDESFYRYEELEDTYDFYYLFQIDEIHFYYADLSALPHTKKPIRYLRQYNPQMLAFASITGYQLYLWLANQKYCGHCGTKMVQDENERAMRCPSCQHIVYPTIMPAVIVGILNGDQICVSKFANSTYKSYALISGYAEIGETIEECVRREVKEEVGLDVKDITYYKSQPWSFSSSLLMGFFCKVDGSTEITIDEKELKMARWASRDEEIDSMDDASLTSEMIRLFKEGKV